MSDGIEVEQMIETKPRRMPMATSLDKDAIREAYEDVRSDLTDTEWAVFKFDGAQIICSARGQCFEEFREQFGDNERAFGYIRIQMGDEMSKRKKFIFLTWIGQDVGVIQRAKMSTDKAIIKDVLNNFAVELQAGADTELDIELFRDALNRAGGANYGTGIEAQEQETSVADSLYKNVSSLEAIFHILDADQSGHISLSEFSDACDLLEKHLPGTNTREQLLDMCRMMDLNKDGLVDLNEFLEAFRLCEQAKNEQISGKKAQQEGADGEGKTEKNGRRCSTSVALAAAQLKQQLPSVDEDGDADIDPHDSETTLNKR